MPNKSVPWRIEMLGGFYARREGQVVARFQSRKTGSLLAYLSLNPSRQLTRDELIERLWPETDTLVGRHRFCQSVFTIRKLLEPKGVRGKSVLTGTHTYIRLSGDVVTTDVHEFQEAIDEAAQVDSVDDRIRLLSQAIELYKGPFLPGSNEDWVLLERDRLAATCFHAIKKLADMLEEKGDLQGALAYHLRAVSIDHMNEDAHHDIVRLLVAMGRTNDAKIHYRRFARVLKRELVRKPRKATLDLISRIAWKRARARLKRSSILSREPRRLTVEPTVKPAGRSRTDAAARLPLRITRLYGREETVADLLRMLRPDAPDGGPDGGGGSGVRRLVTLTGPAGTGKTRVALESAHRLKDAFGGRVIFVPLVDTEKADQIPDAILAASESTRKTGEALGQVVEELYGEPTLVVLDNIDHVVKDAGPVARKLLERIPDLSLLITSREPLRMDGEAEYIVPPLPVPTMPGTPERLLEFPSVQMFVDRAQAAASHFQLSPRNAEAVAKLCQNLDGIPLAIELAAARANVLTPAQMVDELKDRFEFLTTDRSSSNEQHKTMRAAVEWSYDVLPDDLKDFFNRLSVFRGGWNLRAVRHVCNRRHGIDLLEHLVRRSLITAEPYEQEMRYRMLETLREFADERLKGDDRAETLARHQEYYLQLAEESEPLLRSHDAASAYKRLEIDDDNIRAAMTRAADSETGLRIAGALWRYWALRGQAAEGREWLVTALEANTESPVEYQIRALNGLGVLTQRLGKIREARRILEQASFMSRRMGDAWSLSESLNNLGVVTNEQGEYDYANAYMQEALEIRRGLDDSWGVARSLTNLGMIAQNSGDLDLARRCYRESLEIYQEMGDMPSVAIILTNLGGTAFDSGDHAAARAAYQDALYMFREFRNRPAVAILLHNLGEVYLRQGDIDEAKRLLKDSLESRKEIGDRAGAALTIASLANIASHEGDPFRAAKLFAAAEAIHESCQSLLPAAGRKLLDQDIAETRRLLTVADFESAWASGKTLSFSGAVAYAMQEPIAGFADSASEILLTTRYPVAV